MTTRRALLSAITGGGLLYPVIGLSKPQKLMTIVVPYPPGGPLDVSARILAEALKSKYGKTIVRNIPGAAGARGMLEVKNSKPDGKTLVMGAVATMAINPLTIENMPYCAEDFRAVILISDVPNVLVMSPETMKRLGIKTASDFLSYLKANPGKLNCASGGIGSIGHIANLILSKSGFKSEHVPYSGATMAQLSCLTGETDFLFDNYASAKPAIDDGRLIPLAVTTEQRYEAIKAPTMTDLRLPMNISTWFGLLAPKSTPKETCKALFKDIAEALEAPAVYERLLKVCSGVNILGPEPFDQFIKNEQAKYQKLFERIKENGL